MKKSDKIRFLLVGVCVAVSMAILIGGVSPGRDLGGEVSFVVTTDKDSRAANLDVLKKRIDSLHPADAAVVPSGSDQIVIKLSRRDEALSPVVERLCREPGLISLQLVHRKSDEWVKQLWDSQSAPEGYAIEMASDGRHYYASTNDYLSSNQDGLSAFHPQAKCKFVLAPVTVSGRMMFQPYYLEQQPEMSGVEVDRAWIVASVNGEWTVVLRLGHDAKRTYREITAEHCPYGRQNNDSETGRQLAIMMDQRPLSFFTVPGVVDDGNIFIERVGSRAEAKHLRNICASGFLSRTVKNAPGEVNENSGQHVARRILLAVLLAGLAIGSVVIAVWPRYGFVIGTCVLVMTLLMPFGMLIAAGILELVSGASGYRGFFLLPVITVSGLAGAGLALTVGVGLIASIAERISDEVRTGKVLAIAVTNGYRKATDCVIDAVGAGLLAGLLIYLAGAGSGKSFAVTLCAGLLAALFVVLVVARTALSLGAARRTVVVEKSPPEPFARIDFVSKRLYAIILSSAIILLTCGLLIFNGYTGRQVVLFRDMLNTAPAFILAVIGAMGWMLARFGMRQAIGVAAAAINAILLAVGVFGIFGHPVGPAAAGALVVIAGCSVYVALAIFDRARELGKDIVYRRKPAAEVLNAAVRRTLRQTLMTCGVVLLGGAALMLVCRGAVLDFGLVLFIGAFCAAYSSIFVAVPVALALSERNAAGLKTP